MLPGRGRRAFAMAVAMLAVCTVPALAAGPPGPEWPLHTTTTDDQYGPDIAPLPSGGFVAVWESENHTSSGDAVVVRRFDAAGAALGGEVVVAEAAGRPAIASAPDGRFVVVWETFDLVHSNEVKAKVFGADGAASPDVIAVNTTTTGSQKGAEVAMGSDGAFVVVWERDTGSSAGVDARRFAASGVPSGGEFVVGSANADDGEPAIAMEPGGGFVVSWTDHAVGDVFFRRFDAGGTAAYDAKAADAASTIAQSFSDVELTPSGFLVAWTEFTNPSIRARLFGSDGTPQDTARPVTQNPSVFNSVPHIARAPDGSFTIAWDGPNDAIARRFDAALAPLTGELTLPAVTGANSATGDVISFADRFVAAFEHDDPDPLSDGSNGAGVFARSFPFDPLGGGGPDTQPPAGGGGTTTPPAGGGDTTPPAGDGGTATPPPGGGTATPAAAGTASAPAAPVVTPARKVTLAGVLASVPSTRRCVSRRSFRIRLRHPQGTRIATATVRVDGKRVATRRGKRVTAAVNLRGLPRGRFTVEIAVKLADGRTVKGKRRYRTCAPKRRGGRPRV